MITVVAIAVGILLGYLIFSLGFRMGVIAAVSRMEAIRVQMEDIMRDLQDLNTQWTEDDL